MRVRERELKHRWKDLISRRETEEKSIIVPYQVMTIFLLIVRLCSLHEHEDPEERKKERKREEERKRNNEKICQTTKSQIEI